MKSLSHFLRRLTKNPGPTQEFIGFRHANGVGIRSKYYIFPLSRGASGFARAIATDASLTLIENRAISGDIDSINEIVHTFLPQLARHRNTAGIFIIALGDEPITAASVAAEIQALGVVCEYLVINECPDVELAVSLALATAQEFKSIALSGLEQVNPSILTIAYREIPPNLDDVVALLEKDVFKIRQHQMTGSRGAELLALSLQDSHAILCFVGATEYPSGTVVTPVINVASDSILHQSISTEFDLDYGSSAAAIVKKVQDVFGMIPTISEALGIHEPLFEGNVPSLNDVADPNEICLLPANPILISFLIDLVSNQTGFFLKDWENFDKQDVAARKILVIGTGGAGDEIFNSLESDSRVKKLKVSEFGSFHGLAAAILAES